MANSLYDKGREGFLDGSIDWDTDVIKVVACDSGYTPNLLTDTDLADVTAGARVATSPALTSKTVTGGVADADDPVFSSVAAGKTIVRVVLYKDTGNQATSRLIGMVDTLADGNSVSVPTSGGDVIFRWSDGPNKIFKL